MNASQLDEEAIFQVARRIVDPEARAAYLEQVCGGDAAFLRRVERLLLVCEEEASFLATPACAVTADRPAPAEGPGDVVGPYRLMEAIGEGGMGVVYVAEQHQPMRRKVALKLIKPGMDSKAVIARFEAERQALALMDHPNIAKVLDAGTTGEGRPYFVMELVRGIPITDYCDREQLSIPERLELFVLVCRAVQHAHQKGVIHRDLKPSNILVTLHDGVPVPKVIDFGIAKAVGQSLTEKTVYTGFLQLVGTPLYMSPEQADLSGLDVDTRSDIYSLGVMLYELLTGTTPFDAETLRKAAFDEMRRIIREEEPPKPSTRLSSLGEKAAGAAMRRGADLRRLDRAVRGELDWIAMKALEKDRRRRYETAGAFAADVMNYLADRPVEACPPSAGYRLGKFARRNRAALTTVALLAVALLAGTAVSVWQAVRAVWAERMTAVALAEARLQRQQARQAVDDMYTQVAEKWLAEQPALTTLQREFLEKALAFYLQFAAAAGPDPQVRHEAIRALYRVGVIRQSLGRNAEAEAAFRKVVGLGTDLVRQYSDRPEYRLALAEGRLRLAVLLRKVGKPFLGDADLDIIGRNPDTGEPVSRKSPSRPPTEAEREVREAGRALAGLRAAIPADAAYRRRLAEAHASLCGELTFARRIPEAEAAVQAVLEMWEALVKDFPADIENRYGLAKAYSTQGMQLMWWGGTRRAQGNQVMWSSGKDRMEKAEAALRRADVLLSKLQEGRPTDPRFRGALAPALGNLGVILSWTRRFAEAERVLRRSMTLEEGLVADFPDVPRYQEGLAKDLNNLANAVNGQGRSSESEDYHRKAVAIWRSLAERNPDVPEYEAYLLELVLALSDRWRTLGQLEQARRSLEPAVLRARPLVIAHSGTIRLQACYTMALDILGLILLELGDDTAAERTVEEWARAALSGHERNERERVFINSCYQCLVVAVPRAAQLAARAARGIETDVRPRLDVRARFLKTRMLIQEARRLGLADLQALSLEDLPNLVMVADFLTTAPEGHRDPELALQSARRAVALKSDKPDDAELAWHALGAAQYRAGDWKGCIETLEGHTQDPQKGSFALAMAYWQSGAKDRARECFALADAWLREWERKRPPREYPSPAMLRLLRAEAENLLGVKSEGTPGNTMPGPGVGGPTEGTVAGDDRPVADPGRKEFRFSKGRIHVNSDGVWVMTLDGQSTPYHFKVTRRDAGTLRLECINKNYDNIIITNYKIMCLQPVDSFVDELIYREVPGYEGSWAE